MIYLSIYLSNTFHYSCVVACHSLSCTYVIFSFKNIFRLSLHLQPKKFKFNAVKSVAAELNGAALAVIGQNSISERLTDKFPFRRQRAQHLSRDANPRVLGIAGFSELHRRAQWKGRLSCCQRGFIGLTLI